MKNKIVAIALLVTMYLPLMLVFFSFHTPQGADSPMWMIGFSLGIIGVLLVVPMAIFSLMSKD